MDVVTVLAEYQDYLVPRLDMYEQAMYLYIFRHSRLVGKADVMIGFKSARRAMGLGVREKGRPMSEATCYEKLRGLQSKGCVETLGAEHGGTRVRLKLPAEIPGVVPAAISNPESPLEEWDFFTVAENRAAILRREESRCFYCLRQVDLTTYVIEHVTSRPDGDNSYRNVVAACRTCNNRKGSTLAADYLRVLLRGGFLSEEEFIGRTSALERLLSGELKP